MSKWNEKRCPICKKEGVDKIISDEAKTCAIHAPRAVAPKKVTDGDRVFDSLGECCRTHGISRSALAYRINSKSGKYKDWKYVSENDDEGES